MFVNGDRCRISSNDVLANAYAGVVLNRAGVDDQSSLLAVMVDVLSERIAFNHLTAAKREVLAGADADFVELLLHGIRLHGCADGASHSSLREVSGHGAELGIASGEVSLGAHFNDGGLLAGHSDGNAAFASHAIGPRIHLALELLTQALLGELGVAASLDQSSLAVHHAKAGALAQGHDNL